MSLSKPRAMQADLHGFSQREREVVECLLQGKGNKQIALALGISERTVEFHLKNVYRKLGVGSRTEAVLELGKSPGGLSPRGLVDSAVVGGAGNADNDGKSSRRRRYPMKTFLIVGSVCVLAAALVLTVVLSNVPATGAPTQSVGASATLGMQPSATVAATGTPTAGTPVVSAQDVAHFVKENYPDGSAVKPSATFTKTWTLQNVGTTTWTTDYALTVSSGSYPLGSSAAYPASIPLPKEVKPGATVDIAAELTAPSSDSIFELHYRLRNASGQFVSGDASDIWLKIAVGSARLPAGSVGAKGVTMQLVRVEKTGTSTNAEVCAQLPDTQDWNFSDVFLMAGNVRNALSGLSLENPKSPATYASSYRCYLLEFPVGSSNYGSATVNVTVGHIRVPAENNLEANCARAKSQLRPLYPGLDFTCGPAGFFYTNLRLGAGMDASQADRIIMDAMEQAIYGPWVLSE